MVKKRLGEILLEAGVIDDTQLKAALGHQRKWGGKLGQALLDLRFAQESQIVAALSRKFGYEAVSVATLPRTPGLEAALKLVPRELASRQLLLPIAADTGTITVAMADPSNIAVVDEVSFRAGRRVKIVLGGDREIAAAVRRLYYPDEEPPRSFATAIAFDDAAPPTPVETTRDPFAAMPAYMREGYFHRPVAPAAPPALSPAPLPGQAPPTVPRARPAVAPPPVTAAPPFPPPGAGWGAPGNGAAPAMTPVPAVRRWAEPGQPPPDPLVPIVPEEIPGEPVLASDLAPAEDAPTELTPGPEAAARGSALLEALDRLSRGEDGLLRPEQLAAALARLLLKRGLVTESELLSELAKK